VFFIYEIFQKIAYFLLIILSKIIVNKKFIRFCELRNSSFFLSEIKNTKEKINNITKNNSDYPIIYWFHVASAGEMEQAIPVARKLNEKLGAHFFVTYYSPSAEPFLKNFPSKIGCVGLPIDLRKLYNILFDEVKIDKMFFVRYDIWPGLFETCLQRKIELNLISASSEKTKRGLLGFLSKIWNKKYYMNFKNIFAVSNEDVTYFSEFMNGSNIYLSGDAKWARANERAQNGSGKKVEKDFSLFYSYCIAQKKSLHKKCIVFGSPHSDEHKIAIQCASLKEKILIIYVPHDVNSKICQNILEDFYKLGTKAVLFSDLINSIKNEFTENKNDNLEKILYQKNDDHHNELRLPNNIYNYKNEIKFSPNLMSLSEIIIVDKIGYLAEIYELADAAIIGGGFDGQIHNVLEPAAHGVPVLIGNMFLRAREAAQLINSGGAISFQNSNELFQFLAQWVSLVEKGADSTHPAIQLGQARSKAIELFKSIPDTSEIILQAFLEGKNSKD